ncbi:MAG: hypothetical protein HY673_08430 [Chloroflexi bacterium]|nr:hypothetical protein [Chloroflexota bacterium]
MSNKKWMSIPVVLAAFVLAVLPVFVLGGLRSASLGDGAEASNGPAAVPAQIAPPAEQKSTATPAAVPGRRTPTPAEAIAPEEKKSTPVQLTYWYDARNDRWIKEELAVQIPVADRPQPANAPRSNTIIVKIEPENPVKEISIHEAIVMFGSSPQLEINGQREAFANTKLHIGTLTFKDVDAAEMEIVADVVKVVTENVAAKDNELRLELTAVNVVRAGRGGTSTLHLGNKKAAAGLVLNTEDVLAITTDFPTGLRTDRISIQGPSASLNNIINPPFTGPPTVAFIESITIQRTSVFGKIDVRNVAINNLILRNVFLDDNIRSSSNFR